MDVDAYISAHRPEWDRLGRLLARRHRTGPEVDELVALYQRTATHLSVVRSASPDPALVAELSTLVSRARSAVTGGPGGAWRDAARFVVVGFPAALYLARWWWAGTAAAALAVATLIAYWVSANPEVQAAVASEDEARRLVEQDFEAYYSSEPAGSFAAQVWTNNAWIAAVCLIAGVLILPVLWVLALNALNLGLIAGLMAAGGRLDLFFGLVTPHGLLELTAVFVAAGAGLQLGWTWVDPGPRRRADALAEQGRATAGMALGVAALLAISGVIEAFVTPSGLPTWARIGIGVLAEAAFLAYVFGLGRRAALAGERGDVAESDAGDLAPTAG